ncbi:hypothetical protein C8R43DRAFT_997813 [Mycena crocata]|nr:hypothetical protein C8R43DRAFT_997813 [Mycena crocata]
MSAFTRFLHPLPASRRTYSSFFSKPGGGRYFNSHKPAKSVVAVNSTKTPGTPSPDVTDSAPTSEATGCGSDSSPPLLDGAASPSVASPPRASTLVPLAASAVRHPEGLPSHPVITPKDFQLHQFFSIHRPLLLLPTPPAIFKTPPPSAPLFYTPPQDYESHSSLPDEVVGHPDESTDIPVDADAEAARQLTRALTMSRAGATVSWESTLRRLGLDVDSAAHELRVTEWNQEWEDILADSVKRKRKKKMKKHKCAQICYILPSRLTRSRLRKLRKVCCPAT